MRSGDCVDIPARAVVVKLEENKLASLVMHLWQEKKFAGDELYAAAYR